MKIKEQTKQLIILIAVFAVVLGVYCALRSGNEKKALQEQEKEDFVALEEKLLELEDLIELSFTDRDGMILTFSRNDGVWLCTNEPDLPLSQTAMEDIEYYLRGLGCQRAIKEPDALSDYGLDPAVCTVCAVDVNGNSTTVLLGNEVDHEDMYYALGENPNVVYTVEGSLMNSVNKRLLELAQVDEVPELTEASVKSVSVTTGEQSITLNKTTEKKQTTQMQETGELDAGGQAVTEEIEVVVEVYTWKLSGGKKISGKNEALLTILDELSNLSFDAVCDFRPTEEELEAYELNQVLAVELMDGTLFELHIGCKDRESATRCYARVEGSELIHTMSSSGVESLLSLTKDALTA